MIMKNDGVLEWAGWQKKKRTFGQRWDESRPFLTAD